MKAAGIIAWFVLASGLAVYWIAHAQEQPAEGPRFTGASNSLEVEGLRVTRRRFEAGARSAWHSHSHGQLLFVQEGRARVQKRGEPMREMEVGESDYTGPSVDHWHGATPDSHFIQLAVAFGAGTEWLDLVTDEEYQGR